MSKEEIEHSHIWDNEETYKHTHKRGGVPHGHHGSRYVKPKSSPDREKIEEFVRKYEKWNHDCGELFTMAMLLDQLEALFNEGKIRADMLRVASLTLLVAEIQGCNSIDETKPILQSWIDANDLEPDKVETYSSIEDLLHAMNNAVTGG